MKRAAVLLLLILPACKPSAQQCEALKLAMDVACALDPGVLSKEMSRAPELAQTVADRIHACQIATLAYAVSGCQVAPPPPPPAPTCNGFTCPPGQDCSMATEVPVCVALPPPAPVCPATCPAGTACTDPAQGCVPLPVPPPCGKESDLVLNETQPPPQRQGAVEVSILALGDTTGKPPGDTLAALAAHLVARGYCAFAGIEAVFIRRVGEPPLYEEYHAVYFGDGSLIQSGKFMFIHRLASAPVSDGCGDPAPPPIFRINAYVHQAFCADVDTTLLVQGSAYCASVGYTDGRSVCAVRPEGAADRPACDARVRGYKPLVWSCAPNCDVSPCGVPGNCVCGPDAFENTNPAQAAVNGHGTVTVCTADGKGCGTVVL